MDITYGQLFHFYIEKYAKQRTKRWKDAEDTYKLHFGMWVNRPLSLIRRVDVQEWVDELAANSGIYCANRCHDTMRAVINWGIKREYFAGPNPCVGVYRYKMKSRDRFVQPGEELQRLSRAINAEPSDTMRDFFWMCIFTGARRTNVLTMRWEQIDFQLNLWRIPETKNGETQFVTLTKEAARLLLQRKSTSVSEWVFPSPRRTAQPLRHPRFAWARILKRAEIQDLRIHDLRRTMGSYMAIMGVSPTVIGQALGHKSLQATAVYTRLTQEPVRKAMQQALTVFHTETEEARGGFLTTGNE